MKGDTLILEFSITGDGENLLEVQKALVLSLELLGSSDCAGSKDHKSASFVLSDLLKQSLLDRSQANVGLGRKPFEK